MKQRKKATNTKNVLTKSVLLQGIEHAYLFYCSNLFVNSCFFISNPHKYHIGFNRAHVV